MTLDDLIARFYRAYNLHDVDAVAALYAADAVHEDVAQGKPKQGPGDIASGLSRFLGWFPDAQWTTAVAVVGRNGAAAVSYRLTATLQAQMGPHAPRRQPISLRGVHLLQVRDGLIRRSEDYWDAATFQRQLNSQ
jgi:steroid delta-isomerase-like uncharacterized protein